MSISVCVHACRNTSLLFLGSYAETRVLRISSSGNNAADLDGNGDGDLDIEEVSVLPFADPAAASATTIFAGTLGDHHLLVQVRSDGVAYSSSSSRGDETTAVRHWKPSSGRKVTAAGSCCTAQDGASSSYLLIAVEGGELEVLRAQGGELVSHGCVFLPPTSRRLDCDMATEGTTPLFLNTDRTNSRTTSLRWRLVRLANDQSWRSVSGLARRFTSLPSRLSSKSQSSRSTRRT